MNSPKLQPQKTSEIIGSIIVGNAVRGLPIPARVTFVRIEADQLSRHCRKSLQRPRKQEIMNSYLIITFAWIITLWLLDSDEPKGKH